MNLKEMFWDDSIEKQMVISFDDAVYTNAELNSEDMELTERLCSENVLRFGCCEASTFQIRILDTVEPLKGKTLTVSMVLTGTETGQYTLGRYKVDSDKPTADRRYRDIVAYDAMYDILNTDMSDWYNAVLPDRDSTVTLKQFRESFVRHFGLKEEVPEGGLANDSMTVAKTVEPEQMSGRTVITAICEINGCFGHIGRNGKFQYIHLEKLVKGLYPADTLYPRDDLYPADPLNSEKVHRSYYISAEYEDFDTAPVDRLWIRQEEDDAGYVHGTGSNCYTVQDNFLVYGKSTEELHTIAGNLYEVIHRVRYQPAHVEAKGNPCLEVGDGIRLNTTREIIYTYVLQRTLKGIQALMDTYDAEGEQYRQEDTDSPGDSIIQLKKKTNRLKRTLEETRSEIVDMEKGLSAKITQTASQILLEVENADRELQSQITQNAEEIDLRVRKDNVITSINLSPETITLEAKRIDLKGLVNADELVSKFATLDTLKATRAELEEVAAKKATTEQLNATNATVKQLDASKASLNYVNALNAVVENLKVDKLSASDFNATNISAMNITVNSANINGKLDVSKINGNNVGWTTSKVVTDVRYNYTTITTESGARVKVVTDVTYDWTNLSYLGGKA